MEPHRVDMAVVTAVYTCGPMSTTVVPLSGCTYTNTNKICKTAAMVSDFVLFLEI
jgi:hypothetical protein